MFRKRSTRRPNSIDRLKTEIKADELPLLFTDVGAMVKPTPFASTPKYVRLKGYDFIEAVVRLAVLLAGTRGA